MQSEIVQRTPSVYFKFDDQNHRNFSKSSFALDYSISNHKNVFSNNRLQRFRSNQTGHKENTKQNESVSPSGGMKKFSCKQNDKGQSQCQMQEDQFMALYGCKKVLSNSMTKQGKLKTEEFFDQFQKKYDITFQCENDIFVNEWIPEAEYEGGSGISRGNLNFEEFQIEQTMMQIQIQSTKLQSSNSVDHPQQIIAVDSQINFTQTNGMIFSSQLSLQHVHQIQKTQQKKHHSQDLITNQTSIEEFSTGKQDSPKNPESQFQEMISFGPTCNNNDKNQRKSRKYRPLNSRHFITRDFQNNSSLLQKSRPIIDPKRRVPLKNIENLMQKSSQDKQRSLTRKKPIINTDLLLISTINTTQKTQSKQTNCVWSNPINNKKSSSLDCTFTYDNMFKTNAFRETLKSTTLENWKKKYHKKVQCNGEKKTVTKKRREMNIFDQLFLRA